MILIRLYFGLYECFKWFENISKCCKIEINFQFEPDLLGDFCESLKVRVYKKDLLIMFWA